MWIRSYEASDREGLLGLAVGLGEGVAAWRDPDGVQRAVRGWVGESLAACQRGEMQVLVACEERGVVGFVTVGQRRHWSGDVDAYLGELVVHEEVRRQGVARRLLAGAERWASEHGYERITVETGAANLPARRLYANLWYVEEDVTLTKPLAAPDEHATGHGNG